MIAHAKMRGALTFVTYCTYALFKQLLSKTAAAASYENVCIHYFYAALSFEPFDTISTTTWRCFYRVFCIYRMHFCHLFLLKKDDNHTEIETENV